MKKADFILLAAVIFIAVAFLIFFKLNNHNNFDNLRIKIVINNEMVDILPLDENTMKTYNTDYGYNILVINDGMAIVSESDCKNQICVNTNGISQIGESIFCLPHKFAVLVVGE